LLNPVPGVDIESRNGDAFTLESQESKGVPILDLHKDVNSSAF